MNADLSLPRSAWADHPHWPEQVLLLGSHANFRAISRQLVGWAEMGESPQRILATYSRWKAAMGSHERYEEGKLYPYLTHRFGIDCAAMERGHDAMHDADEHVRTAPANHLVQALEDHHLILLDHLDLEERIVVPALLALSPEAFDDYCNRSLTELLRAVPRSG